MFFGEISVIQLSVFLKSDSVFLIDVRQKCEFSLSHILESHHIPLDELENHLQRIPKHRCIALVCRRGVRSAIGASFLKDNGFPCVFNVRGGMDAWSQKGLDTMDGVKLYDVQSFQTAFT